MRPVRLGYYVIGDGREDPRDTLRHAVLAERAGFDTVWTSDHFEPFTHRNRNAPFAWVWLSAAAERTKRVQLGTGVTAPILRYNPAIVAQAFATLGLLYSGRIFLGLGAGEAINESPCGYSWPSPSARVAMVEEAARIIKRLLEEDGFVTFKGTYFQLKKARLYNKPAKGVPLYIAANGPRMAEVAGLHADGFLYQFGIPTQERIHHFNSVIWPSVEKGARKAHRNPSRIEKVGTISSSYSRDLKVALNSALERKGSLLPEIYRDDIHDTREIQKRSANISEDEVVSKTLITNRSEDYIRQIEVLIEAGFHQVYVSNWGPSQDEFLRLFKLEIILYLKET